MKNFFNLLLVIIILLISACSTLVNKAGETLDGTTFAEKTLSIYSTEGTRKERKAEVRWVKLKNDEEMLLIKDSDFPGLELRANIPDSSGSFEFRSAEILSSHVHGWNEFTLDLLGSGFFIINKDTAILTVSGLVEGVQISQGRIRLKSSRITGTEALANLRNRRERILALTEWMREKPIIADIKDPESFEKYWKVMLFPELVSKSKRPSGYSTENAEWARADSIKWNQSYTKSCFGEDLWKYRDSGAMLRDWEEASAWIYIEYFWDDIIARINNTVLTKTK
jgi:hypothetical protein